MVLLLICLGMLALTSHAQTHCGKRYRFIIRGNKLVDSTALKKCLCAVAIDSLVPTGHRATPLSKNAVVYVEYFPISRIRHDGNNNCDGLYGYRLFSDEISTALLHDNTGGYSPYSLFLLVDRKLVAFTSRNREINSHKFSPLEPRLTMLAGQAATDSVKATCVTGFVKVR